MSAQGVLQAIAIYFSCIVILLFIMTKAGAFDSSITTTASQINNLPDTNINSSSGDVPHRLTSGTSYFKVLFSFFVWNITITSGFLAEYLWVIRIIFVWIPLLFAGMAFYYSLPTIGGG